jgi:hypothetical protein
LCIPSEVLLIPARHGQPLRVAATKKRWGFGSIIDMWDVDGGHYAKVPLSVTAFKYFWRQMVDLTLICGEGAHRSDYF